MSQRFSDRLRCMCWLMVAVCGVSLAAAAPGFAGSFVEFETGQVRPLALSPDGSRLFAVNTPDNRLEIYTVGVGSLTHVTSVPVGMEPCAVAARSNNEVWVINHLSDSVSIVDVSASPPRVTRTLLVGDEPRDIVFAGPGGNRAFITTAHRGQNSGIGPQDLITPGTGLADVWAFDAASLGTTLGGTPLNVVTLFGDTPRALAVSSDGNTVYAAVFHSGNRTTTVSQPAVQGNGGLPSPTTNFLSQPQPQVGLVVKFNGTHWTDERNTTTWDSQVNFTLPDKDVFLIDATANPPVAATGPGSEYTGVGTILFSMAVNPTSGKVYVANTDALNDKRFEGPGTFAGHSVRGHLHESRITVLSGGTATPHHLNNHIVYSTCCATNPNAENAKSLAFPQEMAVTADGNTLYVAALGSSKVGRINVPQLEADTFLPDTANEVPLTGGGPTGLILDEARNQLYVLTRFDNSISVIDTTAPMPTAEVAHVALFNPEPASIVNGRPFLYDASFTSSHGDSACASCHVFGDFDSLAWDLGNPDGTTITNPGPFRVATGPFRDFAPMKGPMTTQSLRGMANRGPMHWRGDRTGGNDPGGSTFDSDAAFKKFNGAFADLLGRSGPLTAPEMQAFTDFILQVTYPPNPVRALDNVLNSDQQAGHDFYFGPTSDGFADCNGCHVLDPLASHFGTDGRSTFEGETQFFKIPHLRNAYQKIGMFTTGGPQVRGFGFLHDGSVPTVFNFLQTPVFAFPGGDAQRRQVEQFILAYDSNLAPIVGQQITLTSTNASTVDSRIDLLIARAAVAECDLTVKGSVAGVQRGWYRTSGGLFRSDRLSEPLLTDGALRANAITAGQELTYTCVPPGSGIRIGVDRDEDNFFDQDETDALTTPTNAASFPTTCGNGTMQVGEECDDGNVTSGDGCSSTCRDEVGTGLTGTAQGGSVDLVVDGALIHVVTTAGQTASQVATNVAAAINGNVETSAQRTRATAVGNQLLIGGTLISLTSHDAGLAGPPSSNGIPVLPVQARVAFGLFLMIVGIVVLRRSARSH